MKLVQKLSKLLFPIILLLILLTNAFYASYPDEFDNILGGKLILLGVLPYRGFFSHHGMISYWLAAILNLFSGVSFVHFRVVLAIFYFVLITLTAKLLSKYVNKFFFIILAISLPFFWGQMLLADTLSGLFLLPAYLIFIFKSYNQEKLTSTDLWKISIFSSLAVLNSPTYLYAVVVLVFFSFIYSLDLKNLIRSTLSFLTIFATPYLLFGLYLLLTGSLVDFLYQEVNYNKSYYIYNYPRPAGSSAFNPIRYAVVILNNFVNEYQSFMAGIKGTDFRFPITATLAITNTILWIYLLLKKRFFLLFASFLFLVYINARSNISDVKATDYQMAVYFIVSSANAVFLFYQSKKDDFLKPLFYVLGFFWFFSILFLLSDFWRLNYTRYMGEAPLIYDRPIIAPVLNSVLDKNDYCWVGPFEFEEMYYLNCKLPSKYHWILPQFAGIDKIKTDIISDYTLRPAKIIVFRRDYSAFMQSADYSKFFQEFLDKNYVQLPSNLRFVNNKQRDFNLDEIFNFRKDVAEELIDKLQEQGHLKQVK